MTEPGYPPPATAPAPPPYAPGVPSAEPAAPSRAKKWLGAAGSIVVAGVAAASWLGLGPGVPEVGECIASEGTDSFEVVDCDGGEAQARVVGVEEAEMTYDEYMADDTLCTGFATAEQILWVGEEGSDGTVLCAEPV